MRSTIRVYTERSKFLKFGSLKGVGKINFSPKRLTILKISDMKP